MKADKLEILVADDHVLVQQMVQRLIDEQPDMAVVGTATTGLEVMQLAHQVQPDVIVMDVSMPEMDGIRVTERLQKDGNTAVVVILSMFIDATLVRKAIENGALGYVDKQHAVRDLPRAIRSAAVGTRFFSASTASVDQIDQPGSSENDAKRT